MQLKVDLIAAAGNDATVAALAATGTIPIVMPSTSEPVGNGIIKRLARRGGNITGFSDLATELIPKRLEMLLAMTASPSSPGRQVRHPPDGKSVIPRTASPSSRAAASPASLPAPARTRKTSRVAVLGFAAAPNVTRALSDLQEAGLQLGATIVPLYASTPQAIDQAFASMRQQKVNAVLVLPSPLFVQQSGQVAQLALQQRLPLSAPYGSLAEAGCLMSYGVDLIDNMRRSASLVDKIFKGAKPADLAVEQPVKFELVINGKTAKALGLKIPHSLLILADKVIE